MLANNLIAAGPYEIDRARFFTASMLLLLMYREGPIFLHRLVQSGQH